MTLTSGNSVGFPAALLWVWLGLCACSTPPPNSPPGSTLPAPVSAAAHSPAADGQARLTRVVSPSSYELSFRLDPAAAEYAGETVIHLRADKPVSELKLHAEGLRISEVTFQSSSGGAFEAKARLGENGGLSVYLDRPFEGDGTVSFKYTADLAENPMSLYRVMEGGKWYVFTQFQPLAARAAFPCFDEPQFKTPFRTRISVPQGQSAVSNGPLLNAIAEKDAQGRLWTAHEFAETKPLPTYLVAVAAGELDFLRSVAEPFPFRTFTTQGKTKLASYANAHTPALLDYQAKYLGLPYPYQKLDMVGVPNFRAGAMENAGLVTYRESILLLASGATPHQQIRSRSVIAHELAHMWFGGLVTMEWWDDTWLNEGFATWLANKSLTATWPEISAELHAVKSMLDVMDYDSLESSAPVRKIIKDSGDIKNAFDHITYSKGAAVLRMFESWLGEETLRRGLRLYLKNHAWGNAKMGDLTDALAAVTTKPVAEVLQSFVTQAGIPEVRVGFQCESSSSATLELSQERYQLTPGAAPSASLWTIPVCMHLVQSEGVTKHCVTLSGKRQTYKLPSCPQAIHPNADELSYYRFRLPSGQLSNLAGTHRARLTESERMALPAHAWAAFEANQLSLAELFSILEQGAKENSRMSLEVLLSTMTKLANLAPESSPVRARLSAWARSVLSPTLKRVGILPQPAESLDTTMLRPTLLSAIGDVFGGPEVLSRANQVAQRFVKDPKSVSEDDLRLYLPIASRKGSGTLHAALVKSLEHSLAPTSREGVVFSLGAFQDSSLSNASFQLLLSGKLRQQDYVILSRGAFGAEQSRKNLWRFVQTNESALIKYLGPRTAHVLPGAASGSCDSSELQGFKESLRDVSRFGRGAEKVARQTLESVSRCARLRDRTQAALEAALVARRF